MIGTAELSTWIQSLLIGTMGVILWWSIRSWIKGVNSQISEMRDELRTVGNKNIGFEKDIQRIDRDYVSHENRLHDHSERLREVEQKQAACRNCITK